MARPAAALALALLIFIPFAYWQAARINQSSSANLDRSYLLAVPKEYYPEPAERAVFITGLLCLPGLILVFCWLQQRFVRASAAWYPAALLPAAEWAIVVSVMLACWYAPRGDLDDQGQGYFHLRYHLFFEYPGVTLPLFLGVIGLVSFSRRWSFQGALPFHMAAGAALLFVLLSALFDQNWPYASRWAFTAVFDPVVRVHQGRGLLIDSTSQYGLYPNFLKPIFRLVGLSVFKFTLVMGVLGTLSYGAIWTMLFRVAVNKLVAILGLFSLLFAQWLCFLHVEGEHRGRYLDLYFQYLPIRMLIPGLVLGFGTSYLHRPTTTKYWALLVLTACGVLWNLDSGLPTWGAWLATLCFAEFENGMDRKRVRRIGLHPLRGISVLLSVIAVYNLGVYLRFGQLPALVDVIRSQKLFYMLGFAMIPMPWPGMWCLVILVYLGGLAHCLGALVAGRLGLSEKVLFLLALLGLGLFAYYQGRSHRAVLLLAWWPCFPMLAIALDRLLQRLREKNAALTPRWAMAGILIWVLGGSALGLFNRLPGLSRSTGDQIGALLYKQPSPIAEESVLLREHIPLGQEVLILSQREAILHLEIGRRSPAACSFNQLLLMRDFHDLCQRLLSTPSIQVFIDRQVVDQVATEHVGVRLILEILQKHYRCVACTQRGLLYAHTSRDPSGQKAVTSIPGCWPLMLAF